MAATALASIGDRGVLNAHLPVGLSEVWIDRDLSWLDFNRRVLAEALDERTPLLERAKFLAIFTSNLDEFFMKRVSALGESLAEDLLRMVREKLEPMLVAQAECYRNVVVPGLARHGVLLRRWDELTLPQQREASEYFDSNVSAALTPLVIDPEHPFPFLSNLSTSLTFRLQDPGQSGFMYARVKVPGVLKNWVALSADVERDQKLFVPLSEIIRGNVHKLYYGMNISGMTVLRITRDAEVELEEETVSELRDLVREQIRQRRYEPIVRLEFGPGADAGIKETLRQRFELPALNVFDMQEEVDYTTLFEIAALPIPALRDRPWTPLQHPTIPEARGTSIFATMQAGDILVHHPYDSFDGSVEHFISAAADDPQTLSVKMTAYRIGDDTPFVKSLIRAAESGKQVACVMEIKARFDEERNLHWAAELERVGAHVTFGVAGLKTHAKLALVVRKEGSRLRSYVHIGTGNYHVKTARLYTDVGLFTCDPLITQDVVNLFHYLTGRAHEPQCATLLVAPKTMRSGVLERIVRETQNHSMGRPARIVAKMNQLEDPEIIEALCDASQAGVPIDLIIRGFCCLRPGVAGRTETVRVRSIIGRFLEHSRIFHFASGHEDPVAGEFLIGSADWMYRNLSKRVEVSTPVVDAKVKARLWEILDIGLRDQRQAWVLNSDGTYSQLRPEGNPEDPRLVGTQQKLMDLTRMRATGH